MVLGLQVGSEVEWLRIVQRVALPGFSVESPWGSAAIMASHHSSTSADQPSMPIQAPPPPYLVLLCRKN